MSMIFFPFELLAFIILYPFDKTRFVCGRLFRLSSVVSMSFNPLIRLKTSGVIPPMPKRTVVVCNHLSLADSVLICHIPWEMKWVAKSSLFKIPFIGWGMSLAGDIKLNRGNRESAKHAFGIQCKNWLETGANIMIFPEGTRSRKGEMGEFKDGAFRLAIETQSDILPLAVVGTYEAIKPDSWKMGKANGFVSVGTPISTKGMTIEDVPKLREQAKLQIVTLMGETKKREGLTDD